MLPLTKLQLPLQTRYISVRKFVILTIELFKEIIVTFLLHNPVLSCSNNESRNGRRCDPTLTKLPLDLTILDKSIALVFRS